MLDYTLAVGGMHCGSCSGMIDDLLEDHPGVAASSTSHETGLSKVELLPGAQIESVIAAIEEAGYSAKLND